MAIISVYIPDSGAARVFDALAAHYGYQSTIGNPNAGQNVVTWSTGDSSALLPIAEAQGYTGKLPGTVEDQTFTSSDPNELLAVAQSVGFEGTEIPDPLVPPFVSTTSVKTGETVVPVVPPFIEENGVLGVITGQESPTLPNPQTKAEFANGILRGFLAEHVKVYELEKARREAEALAADAGNVVVDDGSTASVYNYHMVCLAPAKAQYDGLASVIAPGNTFDIGLSSDGSQPPTHYALEAGITETARQQLLVLELAGGTSTGGVQTLFYVRCDPYTNLAQSTNIDGYNIVGQECSMAKLLEYLGLQEC